jgi:hypothetical protein
VETLTGRGHDLVARDRAQYRNLPTRPAFHVIHHKHLRRLSASHRAMYRLVVTSHRSLDPTPLRDHPHYVSTQPPTQSGDAARVRISRRYISRSASPKYLLS